MRLAFDGTNSVRFIGISTLEEFKFRQCPSKSAVADPVEGPGGPFPSLSQGLDDRPPPPPPLSEDMDPPLECTRGVSLERFLLTLLQLLCLL